MQKDFLLHHCTINVLKHNKQTSSNAKEITEKKCYFKFCFHTQKCEVDKLMHQQAILLKEWGLEFTISAFWSEYLQET